MLEPLFQEWPSEVHAVTGWLHRSAVHTDTVRLSLRHCLPLMLKADAKALAHSDKTDWQRHEAEDDTERTEGTVIGEQYRVQTDDARVLCGLFPHFGLSCLPTMTGENGVCLCVQRLQQKPLKGEIMHARYYTTTTTMKGRKCKHCECQKKESSLKNCARQSSLWQSVPEEYLTRKGISRAAVANCNFNWNICSTLAGHLILLTMCVHSRLPNQRVFCLR